MLTIDRAVPADAAAITAIKTAAYNGDANRYLGRNGGPDGYDSVESELDILARFPTFKILLNGEIIGGFFVILQGEAARFEDFVITPSCQGRGYGRRVLAMAEDAFPAVAVWRLSTPAYSTGNRHLYESAGYRETGIWDGLVEYEKKMSPSLHI